MADPRSISKAFGITETFHFLDRAQRWEFGQTFATEASQSSRLQLVRFWTTPDGGYLGVDFAYPFTIEAYLPQPDVRAAGQFKLEGTHVAVGK